MTAARSHRVEEHPNASLLRRFFTAFGVGDRDQLRLCVTDDLVWHFPGTSAYSGDYRGIDELLGGLRNVVMTLGRGMLEFELLHVFATDEVAITVHRDHYTGTDNDLDMRYVLFARIVDGRMDEVWEIPFDQVENDRYVAVQATILARSLTAGSGG